MNSPPTRRAPVPDKDWTIATRSSFKAGLDSPKIREETNFPYSGNPLIGAYSTVSENLGREKKNYPCRISLLGFVVRLSVLSEGHTVCPCHLDKHRLQDLFSTINPNPIKRKILLDRDPP